MNIIEPIPVTAAILADSNVAETDHAAWANNAAYALLDRRISAHKIYESVKATSVLVVTITIATPGVVSWAAHGFSDGTPISFATTGALPTGLSAATTYYVKSPTTDAFNLAATSGGAAINTSGSQSGTHTATAQSNYNRDPVANPTFWLEISATNRYKMFDPQNNTQTSNADSIDVDLEPVFIATGVYVGNLDADSVTVTVTDAVEGVVYTETKILLVSNSGSSFWNWAFRRIVKKTAVVFTNLPPYADATISISIDKEGGTAKCGMCVVGQVIDVGITESGVAPEIKDYSSTLFNSDGTSESTVREYAKRMSISVVVDTDQIDYIFNVLASYRQTPVVWVGSERYESIIIYGKFSGFKPIIQSSPKTPMSLQIEGMV